eukprot:12931958-Prorocentrum_lima.AAC.1
MAKLRPMCAGLEGPSSLSSNVGTGKRCGHSSSCSLAIARCVQVGVHGVQQPVKARGVFQDTWLTDNRSILNA